MGRNITRNLEMARHGIQVKSYFRATVEIKHTPVVFISFKGFCRVKGIAYTARCNIVCKILGEQLGRDVGRRYYHRGPDKADCVIA